MISDESTSGEYKVRQKCGEVRKHCDGHRVPLIARWLQ